MNKRVFIIHGWSYSLDKWTSLIGELKIRGIEPVQLRVPGLTEPSDKTWDINGYIGWLNDQLKDYKNPVVIGHSNGGRIALSYAQKYPGRLDQLILIDSAGIAHQEFKRLFKLKMLRILSMPGKILNLAPTLKKLFYKVIKASDYYEASDNMKLTMRNMIAADQLIDFNTIKLPVAIIWGKEDTITPLADGQKMHSLIQNSSFNVIESAHHAPFQNHPGQVADIISSALKASK